MYAASVLTFAYLVSGFAQPASSGVTIRSTTTLIQVSLTAQDAKGLPVADLRKDEFEVFDNGRPQRIATFVVEAPPSAARRNPTDGVFSNQVLDSAESRGGHTAILLDLLDVYQFGGPNAFGDQAFARMAVAKVIQGRASTEKLALYLLDSAGLEMICDFGTDRDVLMRRAAALTGRLPFDRGMGGGNAPVGQGSAIGQVQLGGQTATIVSVSKGLTAYWRMGDGLSALEKIADRLAGVPPKKALIWVSYGIPGAARPSEAFERAIRKLNNADVAVYGVDPGGVSRSMTAPTRVTLDQFASETGGAAWHGNGLDWEIENALDEVDHSYVLGYYAPADYDSAKFHKIGVEVARPGVTLRYRQGYSAGPEVTRAEDRKSAVLHALLSPVDDAVIPITAKAVRMQDQRDSIALQIALQVDSLVLAQKNGRWMGDLEFISRFATENGTEIGSTSKKVTINLTQQRYEAASRDGMVFSRTLDVPRGASKLRMLVRDQSSGQIGSLTIPISRIPQGSR
jgi:VWFA-related protein